MEPVEKVSETGLVGEAIRGRFPVLEREVCVNSCSQGALSDAVRAAYEEYLAGDLFDEP